MRGRRWRRGDLERERRGEGVEDGEGSERKIKDHRGFIGDVVIIIIIP